MAGSPLRTTALSPLSVAATLRSRAPQYAVIEPQAARLDVFDWVTVICLIVLALVPVLLSLEGAAQ